MEQREYIELRGYIEQHYSIKSVSGYLNTIGNYTAYMQEKAVNATYNDVLEYLSFLRNRDIRPRTIRNILFAIKIYYRYLVATNQRIDHPCQRLHLKDRINRSIPIENLYNISTLEQMLETHTSSHKILQQRDRVIISLLIYQALTVDELCRARIKDIDLYGATIHITGCHSTKNRKSNKSRILSLKPEQIMLLHHYLNDTRPQLSERNNNPLTNDLQALILSEQGASIKQNSSINRIINRNRPPQQRINPTRIRQSVIAHLLKQNNDIRVVQVFAGHRRAGSTEQYKQSGLAELKNAINKHHPLQ